MYCNKCQYKIHTEIVNTFYRWADSFIRFEKILKSQKQTGYHHNKKQNIKHQVNRFYNCLVKRRFPLFFNGIELSLRFFKFPNKFLIGQLKKF